MTMRSTSHTTVRMRGTQAEPKLTRTVLTCASQAILGQSMDFVWVAYSLNRSIGVADSLLLMSLCVFLCAGGLAGNERGARAGGTVAAHNRARLWLQVHQVSSPLVVLDMHRC